MSQIKLIALLIAVIGFVLIALALLTFTNSPHLGTPIWHICQEIIVLGKTAPGADPKLVEACSTFHSQLTELAASSVRLTVLTAVSGLLLLLVSCWLFVWARNKLPPNKSFKPTPLRGAA